MPLPILGAPLQILGANWQMPSLDWHLAVSNRNLEPVPVLTGERSCRTNELAPSELGRLRSPFFNKRGRGGRGAGRMLDGQSLLPIGTSRAVQPAYGPRMLKQGAGLCLWD